MFTPDPIFEQAIGTLKVFAIFCDNLGQIGPVDKDFSFILYRDIYSANGGMFAEGRYRRGNLR
jgi:hypothetical protein